MINDTSTVSQGQIIHLCTSGWLGNQGYCTEVNRKSLVICEIFRYRHEAL